MTLSFIRVFFLMLSGIVGYYVGTLLELQGYFRDLPHNLPLLGAQTGCISGLILIFVEQKLQRVSVRGLSSVVFGLLLGVIMAKLISSILALLPIGPFILSIAEIVLTLTFSYLGAVMALRGKDEFNIIIPYVRFKREDVHAGVILVDTSAIIDGRISSIYKTNFLAGRLVVPRSVLDELQKLADSENDAKREKGRRGMDILRNMQNDPKLDIQVHEDDLSDQYEGVDAKLIALAKVLDASICSTDYNLNRNAAMQGIEVLNVHDLVTAVKPEVFMGEQLSIALIKEGKEANQAVGYLEDGTMIVVSDAQKHIGEVRKVEVSSVLQTQAGKMIFAKLVDES